MTEETDRMKLFEERMKAKQEVEDKKAAEEAEKNRQAYLRRTGRSEMKP